MSKITVYQKPTCTTCRKVYKALTEEGVSFNDVNYYIDKLTKSKLKELIKKMDINPKELLRKKEQAYKDLIANKDNLTSDQIIDLMSKHPDLIERPIVEKGNKAILARPAERLKEIL